jgi:hypothetical protein
MVRTMFIGAIAALFASFLTASAASAATSGDVLVATGTVTDSAGSALPMPLPSMPVSLYAWPSADVLDGLAEGATVPTTLLATTTTDSTGGYSLYVSSASLAAAAVSGTDANLEVDVGTGEPWFFVTDTANPAPTTVNTSTTTSGSDVVPVCWWSYVRQLNREWASVGSTYIWRLSPGVVGKIVYSNGQSSHLGVGFSDSGAFGSFSSDGTVSRSSTTTIGFPYGHSGDFWEYQTQWRTALYVKRCNPPPPGSSNNIVGYKAQANGFIGGQNIVSETSPPATQSAYCSRYLPGPGSSFQTQNEKAVIWNGSLGLTMSDIGFNATAQTGYDSSAQLTYDFSNATQTNYVCGTNTYAANARRTVVQSHT